MSKGYDMAVLNLFSGLTSTVQLLGYSNENLPRGSVYVEYWISVEQKLREYVKLIPLEPEMRLLFAL